LITPTTPEHQRLWRLIVLAGVITCRDNRPAGATIPGLQLGLSLLGDAVVFGCIRSLEEAGLVVGKDCRSGHPSGSMVRRYFPAPGVELDFDI
jgi:hypothetical protein